MAGPRVPVGINCPFPYPRPIVFKSRFAEKIHQAIDVFASVHHPPKGECWGRKSRKVCQGYDIRCCSPYRTPGRSSVPRADFFVWVAETSRGRRIGGRGRQAVAKKVFTRARHNTKEKATRV